MSRTYKHTPYCGDAKDKFYKRYANKRVRKLSFEETLQHNGYKKVFESWEICDYSQVEVSYEKFIGPSRFGIFIEDNEESYQDYLKWYIRK